MQVHGRGSHESVLLRALHEGVLLVGGVVSMATYHSEHHSGREPGHWQGVRVPGLRVVCALFGAGYGLNLVWFRRIVRVATRPARAADD